MVLSISNSIHAVDKRIVKGGSRRMMQLKPTPTMESRYPMPKRAFRNSGDPQQRSLPPEHKHKNSR